MGNENNSFEYSYSAKEQAEIKKIREKYTSPESIEEDPMERLRRLDANVTQKGTVWSLVLGFLGALVMGFGMSLIMSELGTKLGIEGLAMPLGIVIGVVGIVVAALAYPAYDRITKRERERIAPEILRLTEELMK